MEAQRYPQDFNGITAGAAAMNFTTQNTFYHGWNARMNTDSSGHAILTGEKIDDEDAMAHAAEVLVNDMGAQAALIKGGHLDSGNRVVDVLYDGDIRTFRQQRLDTTSTHGTGCTLSAAITAQLAKGESLHAAVRRAINYVYNAIASAPGLGSGHGPLNHLADNS